MKNIPIILCLLVGWAVQSAQAQMWNGQDTLYGNEWIDFSKTYYKIRVAEDGLYSIPEAVLAAAGMGNVPGSQFRLYRDGQPVRLWVSTEGVLSPGDRIEFVGRANRDEVDRYLFENPATDNVNPRYGLFNDTATYFLTAATSGTALRYTVLTNDLTNLPPRENYLWYTTEQVFRATHSKRRLSEELDNSFFDGNGFTTWPSAQNTFSFLLPRLYADGPAASVTVRYACGTGDHRQHIRVNDSTYVTDNFSGWGVIERQLAVPLARLGTNPVVRVASDLSNTDGNAVAFVRLRYPHDLDLEGTTSVEITAPASAAPRYFEVANFGAAGGAVLVYDLTAGQRLIANTEGGLVKFKLPAHASDHALLLVHDNAGSKAVTGLTPHQFRDYSGSAANYWIISHRAFFDDGTGQDAVAEYAAYRESSAGGNWKVGVADVNELYEQFGYGVRFHPIAVRNFLHFLKRQNAAFTHAFLVGKGLDYTAFRNPQTQAALADSLFFLPTFSTPAADLPFAMQGARLSTPIVALARLAVTRPAEIRQYLHKVKTHEQQVLIAPHTIEGRAWMKRVIHNSGGFNTENVTIRNYTTDMAQVLTNNRFGAEVFSYYKTSNDPIQLSSYEQMLSQINSGVAIWTIFGHSSPFAVDFDIGLPTAYSNTGRYPVLHVMGCFSGLCSLPQQGIGEQFVLAPDRGAIAYIAAVNYSFINALHAYGVKYYDLLGGADYGKTLGEVIQHTVRDLRNTSDLGLRTVLHQNLMQGDPAVRIHPLPGPDYVPDGERVTFDPNPIGLESNHYKLRFDLVNIGQNTGGSVAVKIEQRRPDNLTLVRLLDTVPAPPNRRTLEYTLPTAGSQIGFNRFFITADPDNQVAELPNPEAELNNALIDASGAPGVAVYIYADDVQPIYPPNYGVFSGEKITLYASTLNTTAAPTRYRFEVDTVETFDSPLRRATLVEQRGGLLEWSPPLALTDSTVYYWRVARDSLVNGQVLWRSRSFIRLAQLTQPGGWNQSHYGQWREDNLANLIAIDSLRRLEFASNAAYIVENVAYRDVERYPGFQNSFYEGFIGDYGWNVRSVNDGVVVVLGDPRTGRFVINPAGGPYNHLPNSDLTLFWFSTRDSLQRLKLMEFLETQIPDGYAVGLLAFSRPNDPIGYAPQAWAADSVSAGRNIFQILEKNGAVRAREMQQFGPVGPRPYGLVFRQGDPFTPVREVLVTHPDSAAELRVNFTAKWASGILETPTIGPAQAWRWLHWQREPFDDASDRASLEVLGVREGLPDTLLFRLVNTYDLSLAGVSATRFPLLKLRYDAGDTLLRTLSEPLYLRVLYTGVPEGALHPAAQFDFYRDTLQQGEKLRSAVAFLNVSPFAMDSLLVKYRIEGSQSAAVEVLRRYAPLPDGQKLVLNLEADTRTLSGPQRWSVEVNANDDQPELFHFNNVAVRDFYVTRDSRNPLLDVTFDGTRLMDGDIVSPKPMVVVTLKDDNPYFALTDTSTFSLLLELPDGSRRKIAFQDPALAFFPADATHLPKKNLARLEWRPLFTQEGEYRLLVNGRDASGNASAALDWSVRFRVILKSSISNVLNYPNPFSTSTCFVYTMTGAEPPVHFRIQIMTVSGRVVREVTEAEFGPLRTGTHRSDFCWDGKDAFGDPLANGVYLYRVVAKKADGSDFERFENQAQDGFFQHGFGKMVLMR